MPRSQRVGFSDRPRPRPSDDEIRAIDSHAFRTRLCKHAPGCRSIDRLGRDRSEITVTKLMMIVVAPTMEEANADLDALAAVKGWNDAIKDMIRQRLIFGDPDTVGGILAEAIGHGLDGITVDLPVNGHNVERIALLGEIAQKALG